MTVATPTASTTDDPPLGAVVDLDGTVLSGESVLAGAAEGVRALREAGLGVVFLTNRTTDAPAAHATALRSGGIDAAADDVLTAAGITATALDPEEGPALVVGSETVSDALAAADIERTAVPEAAETVVASAAPTVDFAALTAATRALAHGARHVATNPDGSRPAPGGPVPETGAIADALAAASGQEPTVFGKPTRAAARTAAERLRIPPDRCLFVGDNPATDVALGRRVGGTTVLVGAGREAGPTPDFRIDSLAEIDRVLATLGVN